MGLVRCPLPRMQSLDVKVIFRWLYRKDVLWVRNRTPTFSFTQAFKARKRSSQLLLNKCTRVSVTASRQLSGHHGDKDGSETRKLVRRKRARSWRRENSKHLGSKSFESTQLSSSTARFPQGACCINSWLVEILLCSVAWQGRRAQTVF